MEENEPTDGPDQILPSNELSTIDVNAAVTIRSGETEISKAPPISVPGLLKAAAEATPNRYAFAYKNNPEEKGFHYITFKEYYHLTRTVAKAFLKLGLRKLHAVAIIGFNSPEWFLSNLGAIFAGGVSTGVYTTNSAEATLYCLEMSRADIVVLEDENQLKKVLKYKDKLPNLKAIIQYSGKPTAEGVLSWEELLNIGKAEEDTKLEETLKRIAVNQCASIIYTSGTTGNPKGAMLSHDNLVWDARSMVSCFTFDDSERLISYLPLSHVAAQVIDIYCQLLIKLTVYFANKDALKGGLIKTLLEVRPTRFLGVPRVWEKMAEKMKAIGAEAGYVKKTIANWAKSVGLQRHMDLEKGIDNPRLSYLLAKSIIFSKVKYNLGFDQCKSFWSGAAPLATDVKMYFASLDIPVMEGFGMSESSGGHTINIISGFRFDSVGRSVPGAVTKIENPSKETKEGEICIYGRHVFMGYLGDRDKTDEALDNDGWLHSGDIGKIDEDNFVYITGRLKEILITAGGENVAPVLIEHNVKTELPFLGQAVVICDKKKFLSMLLTLSSEVDGETGEPLDELTPMTKKWLKELDCPFNTITEVIASGPDKKILDAIQKGINAANEKAISNAQKIQKFEILPKDFSIPTGELGPTMKLKRSIVNEKYQEIIEKFYET